MSNFVYISPNFPDNHWNFCDRLKNNGFNVFGIGDCPYDNLANELKGALTEYYKVGSLENYDEVYRAVAYFIHKYGRIDWLDSNNEYWLEKDAKLREDFNIQNGFRPADMPPIKFKSKMKGKYTIAGVPTARFHLVDDRAGCEKFIKEVGYPVFVKPDNGVGAERSYKIEDEKELEAFLSDIKDDPTQFIMEEYIDGTIVSYDCITDSKGTPLLETGNITLGNIAEIVVNQDSLKFLIRHDLPEELKKAGRATLKAFGVKSRFTHFEFFQLNKDQEIGKKGDIVALEVNMRPSGGISPNMMNYANNTDVYKIWADMIAFDKLTKEISDGGYCGYFGRRNSRTYKMSDEEVREKYKDAIVEEGHVDAALATDMGDYMFMARFDSMDELNKFFDDLAEEV